MKIIYSIFLLVSVAAQAQIGAYNIAKQQAQRASDANAAEQQRIAGATADPTRTSGSAPADPMLEATLKNVAALQGDFTALNIFNGAQVEASQKAALLNDLSTAALGKKPASNSIQKLAGHLVAASLGKKNPATQKLARDVHALFNASHLTVTQQASVLDDVKKNLTGAGAALEDIVTVQADLKGIAEETK